MSNQVHFSNMEKRKRNSPQSLSTLAFCGHDICEFGKYHERASYNRKNKGIYKHEHTMEAHVHCPPTCKKCIQHNLEEKKLIELERIRNKDPSKERECSHHGCLWKGDAKQLASHEKIEHEHCPIDCEMCEALKLNVKNRKEELKKTITQVLKEGSRGHLSFPS